MAAYSGERLTRGDRVVVMGEPFGEHARAVRGDVDRAPAGGHVADHLSGDYVVAFGEIPGRSERAGGRRDNHPEARRRLGVRMDAGGYAVPGDQIASRGEVVRCVEGDHLDVLQCPLD